ncbi:hypothetical protein ACPUYX_13815 [Desulfosporosinus sp. SYSU MS00001]|uniref:hypothetical protein n=1 Tax=Desulfosporosinus sp. SYSU MS00001 TaxID=3416284 RepID=UPI003CF02EB3
MFKGYCFIEKDGQYCPPVDLKDANEVYSYVTLQKKLFPEVRITDESDFCVVHALDGKVVFPLEWVALEKMMEEKMAVMNTKKASAPTETAKQYSHQDCNMDSSKI